MEARQRVVADGVIVEQQVRGYSIKDYDDVDDDFICEWLLRRFQGQPVIQAARQMLYEHMLRRIGPAQEYPTYATASAALGIKPVALRVYKTREK